MTRRNAVAALVFGLAAACSATAIAEPITYFIEPVTLPDGYAIEGGHITTNGTLGSLSNTDVLDYEVRVTGAVPYVFGPSNPQSGINAFRRVNATSTEIEIAEILEVGNEGSLGFIARENDLFLQAVRWSN